MSLPFSVPEALYPFEHRFLDLEGGGRLHYVDEGPAEPRATFLLLHGNPTWSFLYREIIRRLRGRFRLVAVDYPGFGMSSAPAGYAFSPREHSAVVERLVDALELSDLTLVVQDWGGPIGLGLAGRRPERFARLAIGNTWAWPVNGDPWFGAFSLMLGGPIGRVLIRERNLFVEKVLPAGVVRTRLAPEVMAAYRAPFATRESRHPTWVFPRAILKEREYLAEVEAGLARLAEKPVLLLWGDRDIAFRKRELLDFQRRFPGHRTVMLRGAGHYIQEDAPEEISAALAAW